VLALVFVMLRWPPALAAGLLIFPKIYRYCSNLLQQSYELPHILRREPRGGPMASARLARCSTAIPQVLALLGVSISIAIGVLLPIEVICDVPGIGQLAWLAAESARSAFAGQSHPDCDFSNCRRYHALGCRATRLFQGGCMKKIHTVAIAVLVLTMGAALGAIILRPQATSTSSGIAWCFSLDPHLLVQTIWGATVLPACCMALGCRWCLRLWPQPSPRCWRLSLWMAGYFGGWIERLSWWSWICFSLFPGSFADLRPRRAAAEHLASQQR